MKYTFPFLLLLCVGCTSVVPKNALFHERPKTPGSMVAFWQCYTQTNPNGDMPLRGVGGRIQFYGEKNKSEPIKVNGDLTIFLFDAHDPLPQRSVPVRQAIFKKENLGAFYRKDGLEFNGYDFFVPVDELGNPEMDLQVWAVFHEFKKSGQTTTLIYSPPAVVTLPGPKRQDAAAADDTSINLAAGREQESYGITQASYQQPVPAENVPVDSRRRKTETIPLSPRFSQAYQSEPQTDWNNTTGEKAASSYEPAPEVPEISVQESDSPAPQSSMDDWMKTPGRLLSVVQRSQGPPNEKPWRIDSNTNPNPQPQSKPAYEEVSKSGVSTKMWVQ